MDWEPEPLTGHEHNARPVRAPFLAAAAVVGGGWIAIAGSLAWGHDGGRFQQIAVDANTLVDIGAIALAILVGSLCLVRASMRPSGGRLLSTVGVVLLGTAVADAVLHAAQSTASLSRPVVLLGVLVVLADMRMRGGKRRILTASAVAAVFTCAVAGVVVAPETAIAAAVALGAGVVGLRIVHDRRHDRIEAAWIALVLVGLASSQVASSLVLAPLPTIGVAALTLATMVLATLGLAREMVRAIRQTQVKFDASEARAAEEQARRADLVHELRSAILSVQGGLAALEQLRPMSIEAEHHALGAALVAEVERVRLLLDPKQEVVDDVSVEAALAGLLALWRSRGVQLRTWGLEGKAVHVRPERLADVVGELVQNAARHAPGSPIDVVARTTTAPDGSSIVELEVRDRGPGVDADDRDHIFERGYGSAATSGSGLGLHLARRTVEALGGGLRMSSPRGGGASFVISLPSAQGPAPAEALSR